MADLEAGQQHMEETHLANPTRMLTFASRALPILTALFSTANGVAQQLDISKFYPYWAIMTLSWLFWFSALALFYFQASRRGVQFHWPWMGAWWPMRHPAYPNVPYLGNPFELLGLTFGFCQAATSTATFVLKYFWNWAPVKFSLLPLVFAIISSIRSFRPTRFEPIYRVETRCAGLTHNYTSRATGNSIEGICDLQHEHQQLQLPILPAELHQENQQLQLPILPPAPTHDTRTDERNEETHEDTNPETHDDTTPPRERDDETHENTRAHARSDGNQMQQQQAGRFQHGANRINHVKTLAGETKGDGQV